MSLSNFSIYTIVHVDELKRIYEAGGAGDFTEKKGWKTGSQLFYQAQRDDRRMPILFADAATTQGIIFYGFLTDVQVMGERNQGPTRYRFNDLTPVRPPIPNNQLILKSSGKSLSDNFIRPYAIVHTPAFVHLPAEPEPARGRLSRLVDAIVPDRLKSRNTTTPIFLFGYSGKTDEQIERAIGKDGLLIDIRYSPKTRRAGYSRAGLVRTFGERYHHIRELGNADYQSGGIRLANPDAGLDRIEELAATYSGPLFLMCTCEDGNTCHRHVVGDLLEKRGYSVQEYDFSRSG